MDDHRHGLRWAALTVLLVLASGTYGTRLNDEHDQAGAFHNLAHGSLQVVENPRHLYQFPSGLPAPTRYPGNIPVGSTLLNYLALPPLFAVSAADAIMPIGVWVAMATAALAWTLVPGRWKTNRSRWLAVVSVPLFAAGFRHPDPDLTRYEAVVALQFTNVLLAGIAVYFVARAVRRYVRGPGGHFLVAAIVFGPLVYWGGRLKYTMLAALLVAMALWLAGEAPSIRRNIALGLTVALAIWNNIGEGIVLATAVGLVLFVELMRTRPFAPKQSILAPGIALVMGLVPWAMENQVLRGNPLAASYLVPLNGSADDVAGPFWIHVLGQAFAAEVWKGPLDFFLNLVGPWSTGWRTEGLPLGVFALSPILAFALIGLARKTSWRKSDSAMAALVVLVHIIMLTNRVVRQGAGMDARLLAPILPAVGLLATVGIANWASTWSTVEARRATLVCGSAIASFLILAAAASAFGPLGWGLKVWPTDRYLLLLWLGVGLILGLFALGLAATRLMRFSPRSITIALVAFMVSMPLLWTVCVTLAAGTRMASEEPGAFVGQFLPLSEVVERKVSLALAPFRFPIVTENNYTVFHPDYGYCDTSPSPCPWGNRGTSTA